MRLRQRGDPGDASDTLPTSSASSWSAWVLGFGSPFRCGMLSELKVYS